MSLTVNVMKTQTHFHPQTYQFNGLVGLILLSSLRDTSWQNCSTDSQHQYPEHKFLLLYGITQTEQRYSFSEFNYSVDNIMHCKITC